MFLRINSRTTINFMNFGNIHIYGSNVYPEDGKVGIVNIYVDEYKFNISSINIEEFLKLNNKLIPQLPDPIRDSLLKALENAGMIEMEIEIRE